MKCCEHWHIKNVHSLVGLFMKPLIFFIACNLSLMQGSWRHDQHPWSRLAYSSLWNQRLATVGIANSRVLRFLRCSPWECLEERCSRFDALVSSSTLVSRLTRFQVSWEDSSPSSPHLSDERSVGDMDVGSGTANLRGWKHKSPHYGETFTKEIMKNGS